MMVKNTARETWAHPRVGGENKSRLAKNTPFLGSSPRGRGKLSAVARGVRPGRLIPAWAGKTPVRRMAAVMRAAHPRVGGENVGPFAAPLVCRGSSPRGRGKRTMNADLTIGARLIPAWAGKTQAAHAAGSSARAHPRVGGENAPGF